MEPSDFSISITQNAVDVSHTPSKASPNGKLFGFLFIVGMLVLVNAFLLFSPGKHDQPSMWKDIQSGSYGFPLVLLSVGTGFLAWIGFRYARAAWASDETFHCDHEQIMISRPSWLDFHNRRWHTYTYPLSECSNIRFAPIASAKGRTFYGIRFVANGRRWALPGLDALEGKQILEGLKKLGADVPDDPKLEKRIKETLSIRDGDTSWLDRSWMDSDKNSSDSPDHSDK